MTTPNPDDRPPGDRPADDMEDLDPGLARAIDQLADTPAAAQDQDTD